MSGEEIYEHDDYIERLEPAVFRLLQKFHIETDCGRDGDHWAECDALVDAVGWLSWEVWRDMASLEVM